MNVHSENRVRRKARRGRPRAEGMRERILEAALEVFAERGFHGTAVPQVARAAGVAAGTLYLYFRSKEHLVNEVFREAKSRLGRALFDGFEPKRPRRELFADVWQRVVAFARREPLTFRFLEMQDHTPYLDAKSRELELSVLGPIFLAAAGIRGTDGLPAEVMIAFAWGALVGLFKAERLGYLKLSDSTLERAGEACWQGLTARRSK